MNRIIIASCLLVFATGCCSVSDSRQSLLGNPDYTHTFTVQKDYQASYRIVVDKTKDYHWTAIGHYASMQSELYTDIQEGTVIHEHQNSFWGAHTAFYIKIVGTAANTSEITMYCKKGWDKLMKDIQDALEAS